MLNTQTQNSENRKTISLCPPSRSPWVTREMVGSGETKKTTAETAFNFLRGKLAPLPAMVFDNTFGGHKDVVGNPTTWLGSAAKAAIPMSFQEPGKLFKEHGAIGGTVLQMLNLFGFGVNSYAPHKK